MFYDIETISEADLGPRTAEVETMKTFFPRDQQNKLECSALLNIFSQVYYYLELSLELTSVEHSVHLYW